MEVLRKGTALNTIKTSLYVCLTEQKYCAFLLISGSDYDSFISTSVRLIVIGCNRPIVAT